jgi:hypothetical protein
MKYNYKINRTSLFFLFFFFIFSTPAISQLSCGEVTFNNTNQDPFSNRAAISQQSLQDSYCVKIYMHVIRDFNGNGGQPISKVNSAFEKLNLDFSPLNIFFEWDDEIDYIYDAGYFNNTHILILEENNNSNGVDIYLFPDEATPWGGATQGIGVSS